MECPGQHSGREGALNPLVSIGGTSRDSGFKCPNTFVEDRCTDAKERSVCLRYLGTVHIFIGDRPRDSSRLI